MAIRTAVASEWRKIQMTFADLSIDTLLRCGQSFRWRKYGDEWACVLRGRLLRLRQDSQALHYQSIWPGHAGIPSPDQDDTEDLIRHYLSLNVDLQALYEEWSAADPHFKKLSSNFSGIRILSQDAWEALVSFICSSNNNISRISQMVQKLCIHYGPLIAVDGDEIFHDFPTPHDLVGHNVESTLRSLGFGYRAKYIADTARLVASKSDSWLDGLRNPELPSFGRPVVNHNATYKEAHKALLELKGVGPKVSDCVCLMGLGWGESVPVDTHVWKIAVRDYKFGRGKSTAFALSMYEPVGDLFRSLWGKKAGWAHSVLFTADLRSFSEQKAGTNALSTGGSKISNGTKTSRPLPARQEHVKLEIRGDRISELEQSSRKRKASPITSSETSSKRGKSEPYEKLESISVKVEALDIVKFESDPMDIDMSTPEPERQTRRSARIRGLKMEE